MRISFLSIVFIGLQIFCLSCESKIGTYFTRTNLSEEKVVALASQEAVKQGYDLSKFEKPEVHYEFTQKNKTWTVFYEGKGIDGMKAPGNHFFVSVHDQTSECRLMRGE